MQPKKNFLFLSNKFFLFFKKRNRLRETSRSRRFVLFLLLLLLLLLLLCSIFRTERERERKKERERERERNDWKRFWAIHEFDKSYKKLRLKILSVKGSVGLFRVFSCDSESLLGRSKHFKTFSRNLTQLLSNNIRNIFIHLIYRQIRHIENEFIIISLNITLINRRDFIA